MRQLRILRLSLYVVCFLFSFPGLESARAQKTVMASSSKASRKIDYPTTGVSLGNGWESTEGEKTYAVCTTFAEKVDDNQDKSLEMHAVTDQYSLMNTLKISAELEVKALGGSATGKTDFVHESEIKNEDSNFAVRAFVQNGVHYAMPEASTGVIGLTPRALALAKSDLIQFYRTCGDSFVSELYGGAELDAVLTFKTRSESEKEALTASLNISGPSFSATASVEKATESHRKLDDMRLHFHEEGGSCDSDKEGTCDSPKAGTNNTLPTGKDELVDKINKLPALAKKYPKYFQIGITRYDALPDFPANRSKWNLTSYDAIAAQYLMYNSLRKQVEYILSNENNYILNYGVTYNQLQAVNQALFMHTQSLSRTAHDCIDSDGQNCQLNPADKQRDYEYRTQMPMLKGSFQGDADLAAASTDYVQKVSDYNQQKEAYDKAGDFWTVLFKSQLDAKIAAYQASWTKLQNLQVQYGPALKAAIAKIWIQDVRNLRCKYDVLNPGCISPADVTSYVNRIKIQPPAWNGQKTAGE